MGLLGISFGFLAALSLWAAWRDDEWRVVSFALILSYVVSNVAVHFAEPVVRPGIYTSTEVIIALTAVMAAYGRYRIASILMLIFTFASVACNLELSGSAMTKFDLYTHEVRTNILYIAENLCVILTGVRQRDHFGDWFSFNRRDDTVDAFAKETGDQ